MNRAPFTLNQILPAPDAILDLKQRLEKAKGAAQAGSPARAADNGIKDFSDKKDDPENNGGGR